jgi:hypothetical protein
MQNLLHNASSPGPFSLFAMLASLKISMLHWFAGAIAQGNGGAVPR